MKLTYARAARLLSRRPGRRRLAPDVFLERDDQAFEVSFRGTVIVRLLPDGRFVLNADTWRTQIAKRMLSRFGPVRIDQRKGRWYLADGRPFFSGIEVGPPPHRVRGVEATGQLTRTS